MKSSIKKRFFLTFLIILLVSELSLLALSKLFLDDIVISANKILIRKVYNEYKPYLELNNVDIEQLNSISSKNDIGIVVYDNGTVTACSSLFLCKNESSTLPTYVTNYLSYVNENESASRIINLKLLNVNQLVYMYNMGNGRFIIIDKALHSIEEISQIMIGFIQITGVLVFIIGSIVIYVIGNEVTKPIIKISHYANDIANLKLDDKISITNHDEIGQLAQNMNLISERLNIALKELNERNESLKEDLEKEKELDRKRVKFFSTVSHEFKTPITIIQGYAEGMKHHVVKSQEDMDEYCDVIIEESKKMGRFVNDLLNLSLYESGNFMLNKTDFDIVELINITKNKFNEAISDKQIHFQFDGIQSSIINADKHRVEQIINNLISNAVKHVEENGIIKISINDDENHVILRIFNNGERIDKKEINNIWSLFYKLENNKNHIGTGIGLAIVKSIVELHHGNYGVVNKKDGVEFYIELPRN
ncbi:HAMP domain-containing histidine kinase [Mycoplasmatota bacterium]|nr:HAMP domain-containing histidine kinase [Mycoplasmatota bacterium]